MASVEGGQPRRRGRRAAGEDTRAAILAAADAAFAAHGYDAVSMRGVARAATVDPALVRHYFGSKADLFAAVSAIPMRPSDAVAAVLAAEQDVGPLIVRLFFTVWDGPENRPRIRALLSSASAEPAAADVLREFLSREIFGRLTEVLEAPDRELRAGLVATQMVGVAMTRYVLEIEPVASADVETLVAWLGPTVQRYLDGEV